MSYSVICDNEWYFEGTWEQCSEVLDNIYSDPEFMGSAYITETERVR